MSVTDPVAVINELGRRARVASRVLAAAPSGLKDRALHETARLIRCAAAELMEASRQDVEAARAAGQDRAFLDRLGMGAATVESMAAGLEQIAALPDPVGEITDLRQRPSGIQVGHMRVPLGVVGMVYEARPNVTVDAAGLCIKSGNATILRGGSEALRSNRALAALVGEGLRAAGLPVDAVQLVNTTDRAAVGALITSPQWVDVIIPRGGKSLTARIAQEARVPVIKHLDGICHVYVDDGADLDMALRIVDNAKTQRYSPCNTLETLLVAQSVAAEFLPRVARVLHDKGVELRVDEASRAALQGSSLPLVAATEEDWHTEYLAPVLSVRTVPGLDAAMEHIAHYGSQHTDSIVTRDHARAMRFLREVDSASVMINASTRFADGFEYGLGAEIGISTDRLHARGPVGLQGLTTQKWVVFGNGQIRT